jgi:hypothetical protein
MRLEPLIQADSAKGPESGFAVLFVQKNWLWPDGSEYLHECCKTRPLAEELADCLKRHGLDGVRIERWGRVREENPFIAQLESLR